MDDRRDETRLTLAVECFSARKHLIEDCPEPKNVRARVGVLPFELLRGHVLERPQNRPLRREIRRRRR